MTALFSLVLISYLFFLMAALWAWKKVRSVRLEKDQHKRTITVLVPFRNEEKIIHHLTRSLGQLDYPEDKLEVIFIDDHSEDNSFQVVRSLIYDRPNFKLIELREGKIGKKAAISQGVEAAKGEIIVNTDADCEVPVMWLQRINDSFRNEKINMVLGGVRLKRGSTFFSALQAIEFSSLIGSMAAALGFGSFLMGNGANLAFRKAAFQYVNGYEGNLNIPSGDDEFLARKILKSFPDSLSFINAEESIVTTRPITQLKTFISQRIRWAGKWKHGASYSSVIMALYMALVQLAIIQVTISIFFVREGMLLLVFLIMLKILLECLFLYKVSVFLKSTWNWVAFMVLQFIYPFYVLGIGIAAQVKTYTWKGRRLSHKM